MLVVIARRDDAVACAFTAAAGADARMLTPADLSEPGWMLRLGDLASAQAVVAGKRVGVREIAGVLTLLPAVVPSDLPHIVTADRPYVAAEMTAFLLAWLSALTCPVFNRPTPQSLAGPMWRPERWAALAGRLEVPARPFLRRTAPGQPMHMPQTQASTTISLVCGRPVGACDPELAARAAALARGAETDLIAVAFDSDGPAARFVGASPRLDLADAAIAKAVIELLRNAEARP